MTRTEGEREMYYTCQGPVSGYCGHRHRTARTASLCRAAIDRRVARDNGPGTHTDLKVVREDGSSLSVEEEEEVWSAELEFSAPRRLERQEDRKA